MSESWLEQLDRATIQVDMPLLVLLHAARNRNAHRDHGEPLLTEAEIRLRLFEEHAAKRDRARRADAGDRQAVAQLVRERAELELLLEQTKAKCAEEERQLKAAVLSRPATVYASGVGLHWPPAEFE